MRIHADWSKRQVTVVWFVVDRRGEFSPTSSSPYVLFHHGVGSWRCNGRKGAADGRERTGRHVDATWMPRGTVGGRSGGRAPAGAGHVAGHANAGTRGAATRNEMTEDWPWVSSQPTRALCVRNTSEQPWEVLRTSVPTRRSSLREDSCAPPASCDDTWHVEAKILPPEEPVFDLETTRDQGSMHQTVVKFVDENGKSYVVKDTSYNEADGMHAVRCAYAIGTVVVNCGFEEVVARPMVRNVLAVLRDDDGNREKEIRFRNGEVSTYQPGVSLESVSHVGRKNKDKRSQTVDLLRNISAHSVLLAAAFDYLTLQYDRVAKNVLVDEQSRVHLIDNLDSSFGKYLGLNASEQEQIHASLFLEPSSTLYVGCYFDLQHHPPQYPSKLQICLAEIQGNTTQQLYETYRLPDLEAARKFHRRAILLRSGLDVALAYYLGVQHLHGLQCVLR